MYFQSNRRYPIEFVAEGVQIDFNPEHEGLTLSLNISHLE